MTLASSGLHSILFLQGSQMEFRGRPETSPAAEAAVGAEHMDMRVQALEKKRIKKAS
jgi:hypothetical protein